MHYSGTHHLLHTRVFLLSIGLSTGVLALCLILVTGCQQKGGIAPRIERAPKQASVAEPVDTVDMDSSQSLPTVGLASSVDRINPEIDAGSVSFDDESRSGLPSTIEKEIYGNGTLTDCDTTNRISKRSEMRIYLERKSGHLMQVAATRTDTLGFVLRDLFSAPGDWSFVSAANPANGGNEKRHLRYHCYWQQYDYQGCGKPESIGSPPVYNIEDDVLIHFAVNVDQCKGVAVVRFDADHPENTVYAGRFLEHHGFSKHDTASIKLRKIALE